MPPGRAARWCLWLGLTASCAPDRLDALGLLPGTLDTGLVAHWSCDETEGDVLHDSSGNGRDGVVIGGTWVQGRLGGALSFRRGDYVSVPSFPNASPSWSISLWVRVPEAELGYGYASVITTEDALVGGWEVNLTDAPGELRYHFGYFTGPGAYEYAYHDCRCLQPDRWAHLAVVVDGSAMTLSFYLDGILESRTAIARTILPGSPTLYLGRWAGSDRLFAGQLDDVAIYGRALAAAEVAALEREAAPAAR